MKINNIVISFTNAEHVMPKEIFRIIIIKVARRGR